MPRMYCSHVAYCTTLRCSNSHHQSSPQEILAVRGGAINLILDVPTFTTSRLPRDPSSQRWNYVGEKRPMNFAWNARLPRSIQDILHAANLRHGTDGFTSSSKEGVLRIFSPLKIRRLRLGLNPRTWVLKANTLHLDDRSISIHKYLFNYTPLCRPDRCVSNEMLLRHCLQNMLTLNPRHFWGAI